MTKSILSVSIVLVALGIVSFVISDFASVTALIPSFFGVVLLILALVTLSAEKKGQTGVKKHTTHAALGITLLGLIGSFRGIPDFVGSFGGEELARPMATYAQVVMFVLCAYLIVAGVQSFIKARKERAAA
ncbi:MAG: hypothetical protein RI513_02580 [Balneolaceae bacterium]|nr:hypothetical protein [Balneolaceae bacterium]